MNQDQDDFELLHNVQIWIDENQHRQKGLFQSEKGNERESYVNNSVFGYSRPKKEISDVLQRQKPQTKNFFEAGMGSIQKPINQNRQGQNARRSSINLDCQQSANQYKKQLNGLNRQTPVSTARQPLFDYSYLGNDPYIEELIHKLNKTKNYGSAEKKYLQRQQVQQQQSSNFNHEQSFESNKSDNDNFFMKKRQESKNNHKRIKNNVGPKILQGNSLKQKIQGKPFFMMKRQEIQEKYLQNSMIISDSNHSNLQLVGSKFTQKHHLYDLYKNSILDTQKSDASIKDSIFQKDEKHSELLNFIKNKYEEQQQFLKNNINQNDDLQNVQNSENYKQFMINEQSKTPEIRKNTDQKQFNWKVRPNKSQTDKKVIQMSKLPNKANLTPLKTIQKTSDSKETLNPDSNKTLNGLLTTDESLNPNHSLQQPTQLQNPLKQESLNKQRRPLRKINNAAKQESSYLFKQQEDHEKLLKMQKEIKQKYNDISITQRQANKDEPYKYIVIRGNNSELVKRCLDDRNGDWIEITSTNTLYSFKWVPFSKGIRFDYLSKHGQKKMVNHFEGQDQISQKDTLYMNMSRYYENLRMNVFNNLPVTFVVDMSNQNSFIDLEKFTAMFNLLEKSKEINDISSINHQIDQHPHFLNPKYTCSTHYHLTETMFTGQNFWLLKPTDYNRGRGVSVFNNLDQLKKLLHEFKNGVEVSFSNETQKPKDDNPVEQKINQGCSIPPEQQLSNFTNLEGIPNMVKSNQFVIQKYLEKPLLLNNRKFDIRLWVLVSHDHKCYLFKEGYIRTSSQSYDISPESLDKPFIHLTNNAVQKFNENYGQHEEGNQLSFRQVQSILNQQRHKLKLKDLIQTEIQDIIVHSLRSVERKLNPQKRKFTFEIFGYDFIIDESFKPWLIEVNTNPCLEESSSLLRMLIPRMIDDALKLTLDVVFPPKKKKVSINDEIKEEYESIQLGVEPGIGSEGPRQIQNTKIQRNTKITQQQTNDNSNLKTNEAQKTLAKSKYPVSGYEDSENLWQYVYQLKL